MNIHALSADIARRIPDMVQDNTANNADLIAGLIENEMRGDTHADPFQFAAWIRIPCNISGLRGGGGYFNQVQQTNSIMFGQAWLRKQKALHPDAISCGITDRDTLEAIRVPEAMTERKEESHSRLVAWIRIPGTHGGSYHRVKGFTSPSLAIAWLKEQCALYPEAFPFGITDLDANEPVNVTDTVTTGKGEA